MDSFHYDREIAVEGRLRDGPYFGHTVNGSAILAMATPAVTHTARIQSAGPNFCLDIARH